MIPSIIHQMWVGSRMPSEFKEYRDKLRGLHPEWQLILWGEDNLPDFIDTMHNAMLIRQARYISPKAPEQFVSDVSRYEILNSYGGVWLDVDMDPNKPLGPLNEKTEGWACWEVPGVWANNAAMAAEPGSAWLWDAIRGLEDSVNKHPGAANTVKSGPQYLTPILLKHGVTIYPKDYFFPYLWNELDRELESFPDSYAVHRWNNRRRQKNKQR